MDHGGDRRNRERKKLFNACEVRTMIELAFHFDGPHKANWSEEEKW